MPLVGKIKLKSDKDVGKDIEISLLELFPYEERIKKIPLEADITKDQTRLKVTIAKLGVIESISDVSKKKSEEAHLWSLMKYIKTTEKTKVLKPIKKDEALDITVETA
jgi:hypothetical protein